MRQHADLLRPTLHRWRVYARETDMREAEYAVLGGYDQHFSQLDWEPFDEDAERPDNCDRFIEWHPGDKRTDAFAAAMKVAGHLGEKCWLSVHVGTSAYSVSLASDRMAPTNSYLHVPAILSDVQLRITQAVHLLQGIDPIQPRDNPDQMP